MAADRVGMDRAKRSHLFYQKMSVALWRSNARAIQVKGPALGKETVEGVDFRKEDWNGPQVVASWVKSMIKSGSLTEDYEEGEIIEEVVPFQGTQNLLTINRTEKASGDKLMRIMNKKALAVLKGQFTDS